MEIITDYYGLNKPHFNNEWITYLELGAKKIGSNERVTEREVLHQDAYDLWHLAVRYKEIIECRQLLKNNDINFDQIPRKEKHLLFYLILSQYPEIEQVVELGSSLFELIDGLELIQKFFHQKNIDIPKVDISKFQFTGIEISDLLLNASLDLHSKNKVHIYQNAEEFLSSESNLIRPRVLFDLGVSSYVFTSAKNFANFINLFDVAYLRIFVSKNETFVSMAVGKSLIYFSIEEFLSYLSKPLYFLFTHRTKGHDKSMGKPVMAGFFIYGQPDRVHKVIAFKDSSSFINRFLNEGEMDFKKVAHRFHLFDE